MDSILMIVIGAILLYAGFKFRLNIQKISKSGIETDGMIFDTVPSKQIYSKASYPLIRFVTSEKQWITEEYNVSTIANFFKKGQKIIVVYNPENPKEFFVKSPVTTLAPIFFLVLGMIILAISICKLLHVQF